MSKSHFTVFIISAIDAQYCTLAIGNFKSATLGEQILHVSIRAAYLAECNAIIIWFLFGMSFDVPAKFFDLQVTIVKRHARLQKFTFNLVSSAKLP